MAKATQIKFTIKVQEINTDVVQLEVLGIQTCSPHFAIHRPYAGQGTWLTSHWKLTHVPTGAAVTSSLSGRNALTILRIIAGVLAAMPMDWSKPVIPNVSVIPSEIKHWIREACQ